MQTVKTNLYERTTTQRDSTTRRYNPEEIDLKVTAVKTSYLYELTQQVQKFIVLFYGRHECETCIKQENASTVLRVLFSRLDVNHLYSSLFKSSAYVTHSRMARPC